MLASRALKGAGWLVFSRFVTRIIDFLTLLVLARILTPADFGVAALATSMVVIVDTVLEVPVTQALLRLDTIDKTHLDTGFTLSLLRSIVVALILVAIVWPFSVFNRDSLLIPLVAVVAIGPIARGLNSPGMVYFARDLGFRQIFLLETFGKVCASIVAITIVLSGGRYWAIAANFATASVAAACLSYVLAPYRPAFSLSRLKDFAGFIGWFSSAQLVAALNWQFDRFLIGAFADKPTLGRYAVASDVAVIPSQSIIGPAQQPVMAAFSRITSDPERMRTAFLKAVRFITMVSLPVCIGISLTADLVTDLLLGNQWKASAPLLSLLALSILPIPYFQTLNSASLASDRPHIIFRLNVIDLCFRLVAVIAGFYLYSVTGVSIARVLLAAIMFFFYLTETRRLLALGISEQLLNIWKIPVAGAAMAIGVLILREEIAGRGWHDVVELIVVSIVGATIYAGTLLGLGMRIVAGAGRLELVDR